MTSQEIAGRIQADLGPMWSRDRHTSRRCGGASLRGLVAGGSHPDSPDYSALSSWLE